VFAAIRSIQEEYDPCAVVVRLPRVLFVDDDRDVLGGLSNALRKHRSRFELVFALGGPAGLEEVRRATFDVVVTDMRMPEIDGASLLLQVRDHDPTTFRMILTGYADQSSVTRALPVAHQFFDKPCSFKTLVAALDRACALRTMFADVPMRTLADRLAHVATPDITVPDPDPAASARILRLAATVFLGTEPTPSGPQGSAAIALAAIARARLDQPIAGFSLEAHKLRSADIAERTQAAVVPALAAHAFTAGLVNDLGRLIIRLGLPEATDLGVTDAQLGAYMLTLWGAPFAVIDAVASVGDEVAEPSPLTVALRAALAA
jgi:DNA-binding NarL/FixJ family response regulator